MALTSWAQTLAERFTSTWKLLSETTDILSKTNEFLYYERALRNWRRILQSRSGDQEEVSLVHQQLRELRKELRHRGMDLSLGSRDLLWQGHRNDSCQSEGFRRMVLFITEKDLVYLTGSSNHRELAQFLEARTGGRSGIIRQRHYLWFRWYRNVLVLSASDTETAGDWEAFKSYGETRKNYLLSQLKNLS